MPQKQKLLEAQTQAANARTGAAGREGRGSAMMQDFIRQGGNPQDPDAFLAYVERYRGANAPLPSTTETEAPMNQLDMEVALKAIAKEAYDTGRTKPEDIKKIAAARGLILEGAPQLTGSGNRLRQALGGTEPTLTGEFEIKRKPRTTTKSVGNKAPTKAKRLKFDAQGNPIE